MDNHGLKTRKIYEAQHRLIVADQAANARIVGTYDQSTFGLPPDWFTGRVALDAGCGNVGAMIQRLHALGTRMITAMDLGIDWMEPLSDSLRHADIPSGSYDMRTGSVLEMPFPDESFDFVSINGVLIHLESMADVEQGFAQGAKKTKRNGYYFTSYGPCGGVMQGVVMPALRDHYRKDVRFRDLIDNLSPDTIHAVIDKIVDDAAIHAGQKLEGDFLKGLFGWDYCVFMQNYIQAPTWWSNECSPNFVEDLYRRHGFINITRLHSYNRRTDIRRYFAPLHYDRDHPVSRILYGEGYVQYIAQKA